jgi:hypothetical protein
MYVLHVSQYIYYFMQLECTVYYIYALLFLMAVDISLFMKAAANGQN